MEKYFELLNSRRNFDAAFLKNKTLFITGATGLIGSLLVKYLAFLNKTEDLNVNMLLLVRDADKAKNMFAKSPNITYLVGDIQTFEFQNQSQQINFVVHCAAPTKSKYFIESPVETLNAIIEGTNNLLRNALAINPQKIIFPSSMEVYGTLDDDDGTEDKIGYLDFLNIRSSYSEGKRIAELYCQSFYAEYNAPIIIARLAMCFGPGILQNETRVYKSFIDQARQGNDIILKTQGTTKLNYISTLDALNSLLLLLEKGNIGEAYNICNDDSGTYTIRDLAQTIASSYNVNVHIENTDNAQFPPDNTMILSNAKIQKLGFKPIYNIKENIINTIEYVESQN